MLQRLAANIDALGDRIHPIVVLMLRKQRFWKGWGPLTVGTHLLLLVLVWFNEAFARYFGPQVSIFGSAYLNCFLIIPTFASFGVVNHGYRLVQKSDPLLLSTSLSDRSVWVGFYLTGLYHGLCAWCYAVLMLSYCYAMKWVTLEWVLLYPLLGLFAGCLLASLGLSISVAAKTIVHRIFLFPIWFLPIWCLLMLLMLPPQARSHTLALLFRTVPASLFEPVCWIPMLVVVVPAFLLVAWKLFNFNLVRRRPFIVKYCISLLVYLTLTALLVGLWFGLWFCLIGV